MSMQYSSIFITTNYCWDISLHVFCIPLSNFSLWWFYLQIHYPMFCIFSLCLYSQHQIFQIFSCCSIHFFAYKYLYNTFFPNLFLQHSWSQFFLFLSIFFFFFNFFVWLSSDLLTISNNVFLSLSNLTIIWFSFQVTFFLWLIPIFIYKKYISVTIILYILHLHLYLQYDEQSKICHHQICYCKYFK